MPAPDYRRIAELERELGIAQPPKPTYRAPRVCLVKGCDGATTEIQTWSGAVIRTLHVCP